MPNRTPRAPYNAMKLTITAMRPKETLYFRTPAAASSAVTIARSHGLRVLTGRKWRGSPPLQLFTLTRQ